MLDLSVSTSGDATSSPRATADPKNWPMRQIRIDLHFSRFFSNSELTFKTITTPDFLLNESSRISGYIGCIVGLEEDGIWEKLIPDPRDFDWFRLVAILQRSRLTFAVSLCIYLKPQFLQMLRYSHSSLVHLWEEYWTVAKSNNSGIKGGNIFLIKGGNIFLRLVEVNS